MSRIDATQLLSTFDDEVTRRSATLQWINNEIAEAERGIATANAERESAYAALAELYAADGGKLGSTFGDISQRLQAIFNEKLRRRAELNALTEQAAGVVAAAQAKLAPAQEAEQAARAALDAARRAVDAELGRDESYQAAKREAEALRADAIRLEAERARIAKECEGKRAAYDGHRLFRYLVDRKFGTPDYPGRGFVADGDRWLAGLAAWDRNYPAYVTLCELPAFAEKRVVEAKRRAEIAVAKVALQMHEREAALGVDAAGTALAAAVHAREQVQAQITKLDAGRATLAAELQALDGGGDAFQKRAKTEMKDFLAGNSVAMLKARAAATPDGRDDVLVARIERAEEAINEGRARVKKLVAGRDEAALYQTRAVEARQTFATTYYRPYAQFDSGLDVGSLLTGYIIGHSSSPPLFTHLQTHYYDATPSYSYSSSSSGGGWSFGGGESSSRNDSSWGGGSSSSSDSGSFSSGGGDSGGGFSTGGGD